MKILDGDLLTKASPVKGRFRNLLKTALECHAFDEWRRRSARTRPERRPLFLEAAVEPALMARSSADVFELEWARLILTETLKGVRAECEEKRREDIRGIFEDRILIVAVADGHPMPYAELALKYNLESARQAENVLITAVRMFRRHLNRTFMAFGEDDGTIEEAELELREYLSRVEISLSILRDFASSPTGIVPVMSAHCPIAPSYARFFELVETVEKERPSDGAEVDPVTLAEALRSRLFAPLLFDGLEPGILDHVHKAESNSGRPITTLAELFTHPQPPVELLNLTKQFARSCLCSADGLVPRQVAYLLYYASIAAALVHHKKPITTLDQDELRNGLRWAAEQAWCDEAIRLVLGDGLLSLSDDGGTR